MGSIALARTPMLACLPLRCLMKPGAAVNPLVPASVQEGLVLASASPRRATILEMLGFEFVLEPTQVEEEPLDETDPVEHARVQARRKAHAARGKRTRGTLIGADTIVVVDGDILGKPASPAEALAMLRRLQGRWHEVHTGVALEDAATGVCVDGVETTAVHFVRWDDAWLEAYVQTGECSDKAGAYAIQGFGAMLVEEIRGCFYNVMGFPVQRFLTLLNQLHDGEGRHAR